MPARPFSAALRTDPRPLRALLPPSFPSSSRANFEISQAALLSHSPARRGHTSCQQSDCDR
eukprot:1754506-Pleurochrysis_carterae.AAC.2